MTVPYRPVPSAPRQEPWISTVSAQNVSPRSRRSSPLVLVIDEDRGVRSSLGSLLKKLGYAVTTAADAAEAVGILAAAGAPLIAHPVTADAAKNGKRGGQ